MAFFAIECAGESVLAGAGSARVAVTQSSESASGGWCVVKVAAGECVADANVVVEVWKRRNECDASFRAFDHDGQPEAEFAQPDGHRVAIDAEDGAGEHLAPELVEWPMIAGACLERRKAFKHVHEEGARSACGIEDAERAEGIACLAR